ncbi:tail fiber domain-containing protein [Hymenobacter sp. 15J16-1T3B]|uniref:tail fiber domain-containing protein n=1 Tax=Hymenobacter sp. 15J16-1T3B TaxID=2886941 RepID=UPI0021D43427|nr:tail fiber domain-containing protein [Hymenobacter sp. 15J16-1T3B]
MKQTVLLTALLLVAAPATVWAQAGASAVGIGTTTPDAKAALDIQATGRGLLIPRMDSAARANIGTPPNGLMVFQTDGRQGFWYAVGGQWLYIPDKTKSGDNLGNHTATRNLNLATFRLVGGSAANPGTSGLRIDGNGLVRLTPAVRPVGTYNNGAGLHVNDADAGFLVRTSLGFGDAAPPISGSGERLMWTSFYASLRAGGVDDTQWNAANMGFYSAAFGYNTIAKGNYTLAAGYGSRAISRYTTALGYNTAVGNIFGSDGAIAMGYNARAGEKAALAAGLDSRAIGTAATALGNSTANAAYATTLGYRASANARTGSFTAADQSTTDSLRANANNQFSTRYAGGYRLFTNAAATIGVRLTAGANAWTVISDSTKKELVRLADGNLFLERINRLRLGSWNYRGQDPRTMRHYGPMAQDFYQAFGHDALGTVGNDSTINQADFDGVNLIAIQALYRQVLELKQENAQLRQQVQQQASQQQVRQAVAATAALEERLRRLEAQLSPQAQR